MWMDTSGSTARTVLAELMENDMNELDKNNNEPGFFATIAKDDGVQRSLAGVGVAVVVAIAKYAIFGAS